MDIETVKKLRLDAPSMAGDPKRRTFKWLVPVAMAIAFAAGWGARSAFFPAQADRATRATSAVSAPAPAQDVGARGGFTAAGYIEPAPPYPVKVTPLISGRLALLDALEGMLVTQGQVIARLDGMALQRQARELQAALSVNAARIAYARSVFVRMESLAEIGSVSRRELEQARADLAVKEAEGNRIGEELASVHWQIENTEIRAPVEGVVFERLAHSGQWVGPGHESAIASIYDPSRLQVWVDVNQRDAVRVRMGQRVEVSLDAEPGRAFPGHVARILPRASIAKNTFQAKIALEEISASLRPDMSVKVRFLVDAESSTAMEGYQRP